MRGAVPAVPHTWCSVKYRDYFTLSSFLPYFHFFLYVFHHSFLSLILASLISLFQSFFPSFCLFPDMIMMNSFVSDTDARLEHDLHVRVSNSLIKLQHDLKQKKQNPRHAPWGLTLWGHSPSPKMCRLIVNIVNILKQCIMVTNHLNTGVQPGLDSLFVSISDNGQCLA